MDKFKKSLSHLVRQAIDVVANTSVGNIIFYLTTIFFEIITLISDKDNKYVIIGFILFLQIARIFGKQFVYLVAAVALSAIVFTQISISATQVATNLVQQTGDVYFVTLINAQFAVLLFILAAGYRLPKNHYEKKINISLLNVDAFAVVYFAIGSIVLSFLNVYAYSTEIILFIGCMITEIVIGVLTMLVYPTFAFNKRLNQPKHETEQNKRTNALLEKIKLDDTIKYRIDNNGDVLIERKDKPVLRIGLIDDDILPTKRGLRGREINVWKSSQKSANNWLTNHFTNKEDLILVSDSLVDKEKTITLEDLFKHKRYLKLVASDEASEKVQKNLGGAKK